eukprot:scaffold16335_cov101-Isochrysis_galbana.AAC.2
MTSNLRAQGQGEGDNTARTLHLTSYSRTLFSRSQASELVPCAAGAFWLVLLLVANCHIAPRIHRRAHHSVSLTVYYVHTISTQRRARSL